MFSTVITTMTSAANTLVQTSFSPATMRAGVAAERHRHHRGDDRVRRVISQAMMPVKWPSPNPATYSSNPPAEGYRAPNFANE